MAGARADPRLLPGTLDLLVLKTLSGSTLHGYGIAQQIKLASAADVLEMEGALYPALQRLELKGLVCLSDAGRVSPRQSGLQRLADGVQRVIELCLSFFASSRACADWTS